VLLLIVSLVVLMFLIIYLTSPNLPARPNTGQ
jgi:hypothetical protein